MSYTRTNWLPKDENGNIPDGAPSINAKNLNNMEVGIENAHNDIARVEREYKTYVDNNILYFNGWAHFEKNKEVCVFQLPKDIEFLKYIPVVQVGAVRNYQHLFVLPYDDKTQVFYQNWSDIDITLTSEGQVWYNSPQDFGEGKNVVEMHIILIPVNRRTMIANPSVESNQN